MMRSVARLIRVQYNDVLSCLPCCKPVARRHAGVAIPVHNNRDYLTFRDTRSLW